MTTPICKHIQTLAEVLGEGGTSSMTKSSRPSAASSSNGQLGRKDLQSITKSATSQPVRMGRGVDPHKVVQQDWQDYERFRNMNSFIF